MSGEPLVSAEFSDMHENKIQNLSSDLDIYAPMVKHVTTQEVRNMFLQCPHEDEAKCLAWLSSEELHANALRGLPLCQRKRWSQRVGAKDLTSLLAAGIIEPAIGPSKAFVRLAFVEEVAKKRRRVLFEPRDLNNALKAPGSTLPVCGVKLPTIKDISELTKVSDEIEFIDFKSFYYQIEIDQKVRKYYRLCINDGLYELCVLPQGGSHSVGVAQVLATTATKIALAKRPDLPTLVYIDNIFVGRSWTKGDQRKEFFFESQPFVVGTHGLGTTVSILGTVVDSVKKTMDAGPSSKNLANKLRLELPDGEVTFRRVLQIFGVCGFITRALHIPWCSFPLSILSKTCIQLSENPLRLNSKRSLSEQELKSLAQMLEFILDREPSSVRDSDPELVLATDASDWGWGVVIMGDREEIVECGEWNEFERNLSINTRELEAIFRGIVTAKVRFGSISSLAIFTDSTVSLFALRKGHSIASVLNQRLQKIFGTDLALHIRWLESGINPADGPSRGMRDDEVMAEQSKCLSIDHFSHEDRLWFDGKWSVQAQAR